jgi:ketosteroid isomerase-like protein
MTDKQVVERFFEALSRLDADGAAALVTDDYEGVAVDELPLSGSEPVYTGPDGIRAWVNEVASQWSSFEVRAARIRRHGDVLVAIGVYEAHGEGGPFGALDQRLPFVSVFKFREDRISMIHGYARYEDAIRAEDLESRTRD